MKREKGVRKFLKEYFGFIPMTGGIFISGLVSGAVFWISLLYYLSKSCSQVYEGNLDFLSIAYQQAGNIAGQWILPSYAAGQFLTYRFKKILSSLFE